MVRQIGRTKSGSPNIVGAKNNQGDLPHFLGGQQILEAVAELGGTGREDKAYYSIARQSRNSVELLNTMFGEKGEEMLVRPEQSEDAAMIYAVHAGSFPSAGEARLVNLLRAAGRLDVSLVAELGGVVIGHIAFSPVMVNSGVRGAGLAPVAVVESQRRQGVAAALVRAGLEACRTVGIGWVVVLGEPSYYARFGFRAASAFGLSDEYGGGPAFQCVELVRGALPVGAGLVRYAPEFASLV